MNPLLDGPRLPGKVEQRPGHGRQLSGGHQAVIDLDEEVGGGHQHLKKKNLQN